MFKERRWIWGRQEGVSWGRTSILKLWRGVATGLSGETLCRDLVPRN